MKSWFILAASLTLAATAAAQNPGRGQGQGAPNGGGPRTPTLTLAGPSCEEADDMLAFTGYLACRGAYDGNINGDNTGEVGLTGFLNGFGGQWTGDWRMVGKSDDSNDGWFSGDPYTQSGNDFINFDGQLTGLFVVGVKQADYFSFYLYNWAGQTRTALNWQGTAPRQAGYSHINLYTVTGQLCERNCGGVEVPEPQSAALVAAGLASLVAASRRRRIKAAAN